MKRVDVQSICVTVIVQIAILNSESFSNCCTAKVRLGTYVLAKEGYE